MSRSSLDDCYVAVLAGGSGTRFWPKSRHLRPKQLTRLGGEPLTMIELTLARLDGFVPPERRLIVTHQDQAAGTRALVGESLVILEEPDARNTANALALAALQIEAMHAARGGHGKPVMISLHADALIRDVPAFLRSLSTAAEAARAGRLALVGIEPEYPETGYGYIERGAPLPGEGGAFAVASFREKPPKALAEEFLARGTFLWNAGIFVWRTDVLLGELETKLPETVRSLRGLLKPTDGFLSVDRARMRDVYGGLPKISIDHAVLETSKNVAVVPAAIGWQDVGSWDALERCFPTDAHGNLVSGPAMLLDTKRTTVDTDGPFVAALGVEDLVVVVSDGAVLVCPKARAQDVKAIVEALKAQGRKDLV